MDIMVILVGHAWTQSIQVYLGIFPIFLVRKLLSVMDNVVILVGHAWIQSMQVMGMGLGLGMRMGMWILSLNRGREIRMSLNLSHARISCAYET